MRYRRLRRRPRKRDLSWGANQRLHPPKDLESIKLAKPKPKMKLEDEEDF